MYKNILKKILFGINTPQEYVCTGFENFPEKLNVSLCFQKNNIEDVSGTHVFLGYKPLIIGVSVKKENFSHAALIASGEAALYFHRADFATVKKDPLTIEKKSTAHLSLKKLAVKDFGDTSFFIFEGVKGKHRFLSAFHQLTNRLLQRFKKKPATNVALPGNLYEQVRIAYAVPRIISVISLGKNGRYNMFPTDLHGSVNTNFYVSSLRHEGKACKQVEEIKQLVISNVKAECFRDVYAMGKNHMRDLKPADVFKTAEIQSEQFHNPLPAGTISYKEAELTDSFDAGIHRLLFYKIMNEKVLDTEAPALAHIHQYCYVWRGKQGIRTEAMLR